MGLQDFLTSLFGTKATPPSGTPAQDEQPAPAPRAPVIEPPTPQELAAQEEIDRLLKNVESSRWYRPPHALDINAAPAPFQVMKARQAMQCIIRWCDECFSTKLITCLWRADWDAYNESGQPITGLAYRMMENGMVPIGFDILSELPFFYITEKSYQSGHIGKVYQLTSVKTGNPLSRREMEILAQVSKQFDPMNSHELNTRRQCPGVPIQEVFRF